MPRRTHQCVGYVPGGVAVVRADVEGVLQRPQRRHLDEVLGPEALERARAHAVVVGGEDVGAVRRRVEPLELYGYFIWWGPGPGRGMRSAGEGKGGMQRHARSLHTSVPRGKGGGETKFMAPGDSRSGPQPPPHDLFTHQCRGDPRTHVFHI